MSRAAWTYSLRASTSVEPRTVRAYCTQPDRPIDTTITQNAVSPWAAPGNAMRATPSTSNAIRIAGNDSCTSATRITKASSAPPT